MSDYTQITDFSAKDSLTTGDPEKIILGADFDGEFAAIETAVTTKYDSGDIASAAQATAGLLDTVLMTPLQVDNVLEQNAGMAKDLVDLADPNDDRLLMWDDSAGGLIACDFGTGIGPDVTGIAIELQHLGLEDLVDPNADRILFWDDSAGNTDWLTVGTGLDLTTTTLSLSHLSIESLTDPNDDRIMFWDDSDGAVEWLDIGGGLEIVGNTLSIEAAIAGYGISESSNVLAVDGSEFTTFTDVSIVTETQDGVLVNDNGTVKSLPWNKGGVHVETFTVSDEIDDTMYGLFMLLTGTTGRTMTFNSATNAAHTGAVVLLGTRDTADLTLAVSGSSTFTSTLEQGGTTNRTIVGGGTAMAIHVGSDEWMLVGDIS